METKMRVLIADPNEDFRQLLSETINNEEDMQVVAAAEDGLEALTLITELKPDVVLLELMLSKLDGLSVLRKLPETGVAPKVIVASGFCNDMVVTECSELGAYYFIPKPCDTGALLSRIRQAAGQGGSGNAQRHQIIGHKRVVGTAGKKQQQGQADNIN